MAECIIAENHFPLNRVPGPLSPFSFESVPDTMALQNAMNPKVNWFFDKDTQWKDAYEKLRAIVLDCGLAEELKWGHPCYTLNGKNVVLIHGFKEYCALLFHKGALLKDEKGILIQQTENVQSARQIRFQDAREVYRLERVLKAYIHEAIEVEKAGLKVRMKKASEFSMPDEFALKLKALPKLKKAFEALTPGRQRGYLLYFSAAKQSKTREARIANNLDRIMAGLGLDDD
jgi:uncharacterized protein YdeI (YjbR/CyaY-like superfamily)